MTPTQRAAALRLADELESGFCNDLQGSADLLRELLAEPVQEPVAWQLPGTDSFLTAAAKTHHGARAEAYAVPLYTRPPQQHMHCPEDGGECGAGGYCRLQQRKPLTDKEIIALPKWDDYVGGCCTLLDFARAIECAHGITGEPT